MVYDAMPIHDHFKKVDHDAVIAVPTARVHSTTAD
jgi:hypothetical protein